MKMKMKMSRMIPTTLTTMLVVLGACTPKTNETPAQPLKRPTPAPEVPPPDVKTTSLKLSSGRLWLHGLTEVALMKLLADLRGNNDLKGSTVQGHARAARSSLIFSQALERILGSSFSLVTQREQEAYLWLFGQFFDETGNLKPTASPSGVWKEISALIEG